MDASLETKLNLMTKEYERVSTEVREEGYRITQAYLALGVIISGSVAFLSQGWASLVPPTAIFLWAWFMLLLLYQFNRRVRFLSTLESRINQVVGDEFTLSFQRFMYSPPDSKQAITKSHILISSYWGTIMTFSIISVYLVFSYFAILSIEPPWRIIIGILFGTFLVFLILGYVLLISYGLKEYKQLVSFYPGATKTESSNPPQTKISTTKIRKRS